jgi:AcrR family transcriptional regulator
MDVSRKEQAAASRSDLVEAARRCFTECGYEGTTVAAILERAGMARGALYHYFPGGKAEIFSAVFELINEAFHRRRDVLLDLPSPVSRLREGVTVFLEMCIEDDFARIALIDAPRLVPGQSELGSSYALLREQLAEAVSAGELQSLDIDAMAMALYGAVRTAGEFVIAAADRPAASAMASRIVDCFIDGLSIGAASA